MPPRGPERDVAAPRDPALRCRSERVFAAYKSCTDAGVTAERRCLARVQTARVLSAVVQLDAAAGTAPLREVPFSALRFPPGSHTALLTLAR